MLALLLTALPPCSVQASPRPHASPPTPQLLQCGSVYYSTLKTLSTSQSGYTLYSRVQAALDSQTGAFCGLRAESQIAQAPYQVGGSLQVALLGHESGTKTVSNNGANSTSTYAETLWYSGTCGTATGAFFPSTGGEIGPLNTGNVCY